MDCDSSEVSENFSYPQLAKKISTMKNLSALQEALHVLDKEQLSELGTKMLFLKPAYKNEMWKIKEQNGETAKIYIKKVNL